MADYTKYVDKYGDLASEWKKIESGSGAAKDYWGKKGVTDKASFGKMHWAESGESEERSLTPTPSPAPTTTTTTTPTPTPTPTTAPAPDTSKPDASIATPAPIPEDAVASAQLAVAGAPTLGPAPTIAPATQRTVHPQELVEYRMSQMMKLTNPYTQQAITNAKKLANQSGLLNTSIAATAGIDSAIRSVLPIAQQDAATLYSQGLENMKAVNQFIMQDYLTKAQFKLTDHGYKMTTYNNGLQMTFDKNENAVRRWFEGEQNRLDREYKIWSTEFSAEIGKEMADKGYEHDTGESSKSCQRTFTAQFNAEVSRIEEQYRAGEINEKDRVQGLKVAQDNLKTGLKTCA